MKKIGFVNWNKALNLKKKLKKQIITILTTNKLEMLPLQQT